MGTNGFGKKIMSKNNTTISSHEQREGSPNEDNNVDTQDQKQIDAVKKQNMKTSATSQNNGEDAIMYDVVINHEEQYSIWPVDWEKPKGWRNAGKTGLKKECLDYIKEIWTDMRPLSLRKKMEEMEKRRPQPEAEHAKRIEETRKKLEEAGVEFHSPLNTFIMEAEKWKWCYFRDPDGIILELVEQSTR